MREVEDYLDVLYPDPKCELNYSKDYEFLIAVVLSAQTTDKSVNAVTSILFQKYDSLNRLDEASIEDIVHIIRPIGTFNKKSKFIKDIVHRLVSEFNGSVPNDRNILESFPGVGRKVTNVVLSELFDYPAIAVDTHVSRVSKRLGFAKEKDTVFIIEKKLMKLIETKNWSRRHHQFVLFGRYHCKAINPMCDVCKLKGICKYYKKKCVL